GLDATSSLECEKGRDRFRSGRERRHTPVSTPRAERRVVARIGPPGGFRLVGSRIGLGRGQVRGWDSREGGGCGGGESGSDDNGLGLFFLPRTNIIVSYHEGVLARKREQPRAPPPGLSG